MRDRESQIIPATLFGPPDVASVNECRVRRTRNYNQVKYLIYRWHSTLPCAPPGFKVAFIAYAERNLAPVAVAMWGRPTARLEDQETTLELTRLAHCPHAPRNMGSWMLAKMRKWIKEHMPKIRRLISYQDADVHHGTIYKADNWTQVYDKHTEHTWTNRPGRKGTERQHKIKWEHGV